MVQFQYLASTGARTGISTAAMEFISSTDTCQVPVPVLAMPQWSSFARTENELHHGNANTGAGTWQVPVPVLAWLFAAQTSEFYCTLEKLR
jgi:hypothetical protein